MQSLLSIIWSDEGQDIAEYAVMLAVILVLVMPITPFPRSLVRYSRSRREPSEPSPVN